MTQLMNLRSHQIITNVQVPSWTGVISNNNLQISYRHYGRREDGRTRPAEAGRNGPPQASSHPPCEMVGGVLLTLLPPLPPLGPLRREAGPKGDGSGPLLRRLRAAVEVLAPLAPRAPAAVPVPPHLRLLPDLGHSHGWRRLLERGEVHVQGLACMHARTHACTHAHTHARTHTSDM